MSRAYLILENGDVFSGQSFGYDAETIGELVFSTAMTGYLETLTDPCYFGQIVLQTFPLAGNYGVIPADLGEGKTHLKAYIVREWCQEPSNFRSEGELDTFLRQNEIPGLCGVDTRALTRVIRENGVMNAMISKTAELSDEQWARLRSYKISGAVEECAEQRSFVGCGGEAKAKVALWSFGEITGPAERLSAYCCVPMPVRHTATAEEILALRPDGVFLSDGPGDPAENTRIIEEIRKLCNKKVPIVGVGLGHQLLALARGAKTEKLPFGHRGANQPVRDLESGRVFVTSQNHGYTVTPESLPETAWISYENCNDGTCEGLGYIDMPAFSVQFRPSDDAGDSFYGSFAELMERSKVYAAE